jgi:uncharacterized membrane protein
MSTNTQPVRSAGYAPPLTSKPTQPPRRPTPRVWWFIFVLSLSIAGYALSFYVRREAAFPPDLRESFIARPWGIYSHVLFGSLALILGPFQFRRNLLLHRRSVHRNMGRVYVVSAFMTGVVGMYMSLYSFAGAITHVGFGLLGALTMTTTVTAYLRIRAFDVSAHREWMIRSFALIFAAVTLRLELPILIGMYRGEFVPAFQIVAWLAWVPNLLWAEWYVRHSRRSGASAVPTHSRAAVSAV